MLIHWPCVPVESQHSKAIRGADPEQMREKEENKQGALGLKPSTPMPQVCVCVSSGRVEGARFDETKSSDEAHVEKFAGIDARSQPVRSRLYIAAILWSDRPCDSRQTHDAVVDQH